MFQRNDTRVLARWWWRVDKSFLICLLLLLAIGMILNLAASPSVAERIGLQPFYFITRHLFMIPLALVSVMGISLLPDKRVKGFVLVAFAMAYALLLLTLVFGSEVKGATRWISLAGFSIQPSEILKPLFAVLTAWILSKKYEGESFRGFLWAGVLYICVVTPLLMQPDLGMSVLISAAVGVQFFLAGLPLILVLGLALTGILGLIAAYFLFHHVQSRVDGFLGSGGSEPYQVQKSLEAFQNGGLFGMGPGEGVVKSQIPDVHSDFIFAAAGEEFGFFMCLGIVVLIGILILHGFLRASREKDLFKLLSVSGILAQIGFQGMINMASTLHLMPTKGMTLPFISYGGSSLLGMAIAMGLLLLMTRR